MKKDGRRALRGMGSAVRAAATLAAACLLVAAGIVFAVLPGQPAGGVTVEGTGHGPAPVAELAVNAPRITDVAATDIREKRATITWQTDELASGRVDFGETTAYGRSATSFRHATSHSVNLRNLSPGATYHYRVTATGIWFSGASQSGDYTFVTPGQGGDEGAPPAITGLVVTDVTTSGGAVIWTTDVPADSQVAYGPDTSYGLKTTRTSLLETAHRVVLTGLSPSTVYHCQAISRDAAGAVARSEDYQFVTADDTPPVISAVIAGSITDNGAVITWTTDSPAEGSVEYGTTTAYGIVSSYDNTMVTSHRVALSQLAAQTMYHYKVKSRDASGLWAESADCTFTTAVDLSADPPQIMYLTAARISSSEATISWSTDELATTQVEYGETQDYGRRTPADAGLAREHSIVLKDLRSGITYHYRVRSTDAAGNETVSADRTFNTPIERAPVPSLPVWAWAAIGVAGAAVVGALVLKNR